MRVRTAVALAVVALVVVTIFGLVVSGVLLTSARNQQREQAAAVLRAGTATYLFTGRVSPGIEENPTGLPAQMTEVLTPGALVTYTDRRYTYAAWFPEDGVVLATRQPTVGHAQGWAHLGYELVPAGLLAALAASLVGWVTADRLTARLREVTRAVTVSPPDIDPDLLRGGDEVAVLARTIDCTTRELIARAERAKDRTADAAHELRTPLTALVNATQLLDDSSEAERVRRLVGRLRTLVDDLLLLARLDEDVPVGQCGRVPVSTVVRLAIDPTDLGERCTVTVSEDREVCTEPEVAARALRNLVANAVRHGRPPVSVVVDGPTVTVTDAGDGYPASLLDRGPTRFATYGRAGGTGLGLTIAACGLERSGATLRLSNEERGARAEIRFREPDPDDPE